MSSVPITDSPLALGSLKAIVHTAPEGGYWAEVPELPGCYTQAETLDELVLNLREAVEGWQEADAVRRQSPPSELPVKPRIRILELAE